MQLTARHAKIRTLFGGRINEGRGKEGSVQTIHSTPSVLAHNVQMIMYVRNIL